MAVAKAKSFSRKTKSKRDSVKVALESLRSPVSKIDENTAYTEVVELAQRKLLQQVLYRNNLLCSQCFRWPSSTRT